MRYIEKSNEFLIGRLAFSIPNYILTGEKILSTVVKLRKSEWYPQDLLMDLQLKKVTELIKFAYTYVPYYRFKFKEIGLVPEDIRNLEDFKSIPPLSRRDVIEFHKDMVDMRLQASVLFADKDKGLSVPPILLSRFRKHKLIKKTSSGSTGAPTVFYENPPKSALSWAHELRVKGWFGLYPGAKEARMVRLSTDYLPNTRINRLRRMFWNQLLLPGMNLAKDDYAFCLRAILKFKPKVLWGITSALTGLAQFIENNGVTLHSYNPKLVVTWAAPIHDHEKKILKDVFDCPITSVYSAREVGHIACMCPHDSFHVNQKNLLVESQNLNEIAGTKLPGEILVTTLDRSPMPFIRYRMGDIGEVLETKCDCGRSLQVLTNLLGRTGENFISKKGRMISPNFWGRVFMSEKISGAVKRFQVIYTKTKDLRIRIERDTKYTVETESYTMDTVTRNFSSNTKLDFEYVSKIKPQVSGKYQMIINESKILGDDPRIPTDS